MKKILEFIEKVVKKFAEICHIPYDKMLHLLANFVLSLASFIDIGLGIGLSVGASAGKEFGDMMSPGNRWDWLDIVADVAGLCIGLALRFIFRYFTGY